MCFPAPWRVSASGANIRPAGHRGFTLLELMVVISVILVLLGLAAGNYQRSILRSKEAALKQNLFTMRQAIQQYTLDKLQAPQSLEDLVAAGYLREIPKDPITGQRDWRVEYDDAFLSPDQLATGISDVHSNSDKISPFEGTPYSSW
ncbi:MAG: type II secretion system GspH family protein [Acidobacteriia bacterium]|jgi:general secretion pathway protein G|nr:type II secretion system GspH family protein [Terriglobia bacterium]